MTRQQRQRFVTFIALVLAAGAVAYAMLDYKKAQKVK